jgi:outer membrane receptor for ferrienterochelin and colicin
MHKAIWTTTLTLAAATTILGLAATPAVSAEPMTRSLNLEGLVNSAPGGKRLLLVDGKKASEESVKNIPPASIERIELLPKDDAVAKTYGPEASNGVINVIMRK